MSASQAEREPAFSYHPSPSLDSTMSGGCSICCELYLGRPALSSKRVLVHVESLYQNGSSTVLASRQNALVATFDYPKTGLVRQGIVEFNVCPVQGE